VSGGGNCCGLASAVAGAARPALLLVVIRNSIVVEVDGRVGSRPAAGD